MHTQKFAAGICARTQANRQKHFKTWDRYGQEGKGFHKFLERREYIILFLKFSFFFRVKIKQKQNPTSENKQLPTCPTTSKLHTDCKGPAEVSGLHCTKYNLRRLNLTEVRLTKALHKLSIHKHTN